jgi:prepilin-type N-terminal cleavage/methylation domain-containing protein
MNWSLFSSTCPLKFQQGFSLAELCVVLGLLAISASWAVPSLSAWLWRLRVEAVVQAWGGDLQAAKLQALRRGETLQLLRLTNCQTTPLGNGDWRCGWQLLSAETSAPPLAMQVLKGDVLVQMYPAQNQLPINAQGEAVAGGIRLTVQAKSHQTMVRSVCINNTGRLRVVPSESCA